jgi:hypothetical protein
MKIRGELDEANSDDEQDGVSRCVLKFTAFGLPDLTLRHVGACGCVCQHVDVWHYIRERS